jgi:F-type H+-transporting ATPase subunit delta
MDKAGTTDEMMAEFKALIKEVLDPFPQLDAALSSLRVSAQDKAQLLDRVLGSQVSESMMSFLQIVCAHHRLDCLRDIYREAERQLNEKRGVVDVQVTTAVPVSAELVGQISEALQKSLGHEVHLLQAVNPDVIGGMVIRVGDKVFDSSVTNRLRQLRAETLEKTIQEMRSAGERFVAAD